MGCIVNGPGESKHADIGISLPGTGETPTAPVFIDGKKAATLRGPDIAEDFEKMVADYIEQRFGQRQGGGGIAMQRVRQAALALLCRRCLVGTRGPASLADPPGRSEAGHDRPHLRDLIETQADSARPAARFLRPADLEGKPLRSRRGQPGRRGRHRPVHAGDGHDARARRQFRHRAGDAGFGEISRRDENRLRQSRAGGRGLQCRRKPRDRAGCPPAGSCRWKPRTTCSTSWASRPTISRRGLCRHGAAARSEARISARPAASCR